MILNHAQFEAALDEATHLLNAPPPDGTPGHKRLLALLQDIAAYRPAVIVNARKDLPEAERLSRHLEAFEARLAPHFESHWHSMLGGDLSGHVDGGE
jgi:hypothetical protein